MSKHIKFRAWIGSERRMERDKFYINQWDGNCHYTDPYHFENEDKVTIYDCGEEEPTLMQFSGRHDKNNTEIYDCDVFGLPRVAKDHEIVGYVKYDTDVAAFVVVKPNGGWDYLAVFLKENSAVEVVGNIIESESLWDELFPNEK